MMVGPVLLCIYKDEALSGGYHSSGPRGQVPIPCGMVPDPPHVEAGPPVAFEPAKGSGPRSLLGKGSGATKSSCGRGR